jgi:hypothetical protein
MAYIQKLSQDTRDCEHIFGVISSPLDIYPVVELLDHIVVQFLAI